MAISNVLEAVWHPIVFRALDEVLADYTGRAFQVHLWNGATWSTTSNPRFTLVLNSPEAIDRYVFPDGELVPLNKSLGAAEASGFEVRDVESLREHYAMTLHHWVRRLEASAEKAQDITDEATYRIWRLYMAGSVHWFRCGFLNLYQMLLVKPQAGDSGMPLSRAGWYK